MFTLERQNKIFEMIKSKKKVSVQELSSHFYISEASIRRDLTALEKKGLIKRTYGGAILIEGNNIEIPLNIRVTAQREIKIPIARIAASLVENQDVIFMDSSTTTKEMNPFLSSKNDLTVITNGIQTIEELSEYDNVSVYSIGGKLRPRSLSLVGGLANSSISNFSASKFFFSCTGISQTQGAMDFSDQEAELRKHIMSHCDTVIILVDHTKFDNNAFYKTCDFSDVDILITDQKPSEEWCALLQKNDVELMYP